MRKRFLRISNHKRERMPSSRCETAIEFVKSVFQETALAALGRSKERKRRAQLKAVKAESSTRCNRDGELLIESACDASG